MNITMQKAMETFDRYLKKGSFLGISLSKEGLKMFSEEQKKHSSFTNAYTGVKEVPLKKIVGSVQKSEDFRANFVPKNNIIKFRWCNIYIEMVKGNSIPPVMLYKIYDEYYVYDGNHRVSVANFLNYKSIEAEVTEFFSDGKGEDELIYREKFNFTKETNLEVELTHYRNYKFLIEDIKKFEELVSDEKEVDNKNKHILAKLWYQNVYQPIIKIIEFNNLKTKDEKIGDIFVKYLKHKGKLNKNKNNNANYYSYILVDYLNLTYLKSKYTLKNQIKSNEYTDYLIEELYKLDIELNLSKFEKKQFKNIKKLIPGDFEDEIYFAKKIKKDIPLWVKEDVKSHCSIFLEKSKYFDNISLIRENRLKLYRQLKNYENYYKKKYKDSSEREKILDYILEIMLPTINFLEKSGTKKEDFKDKFYSLARRKRKFLENGKNIDLEDLEKIYFDFENQNPLFQDWIKSYLKKDSKDTKDYNNIFKGVREILLLKKQNVDLFSDLVELYEGTTNYQTIVRLKGIILKKLEKDFRINWVEDVFASELDILVSNKEAIRYYKTKKFLHKVKKKLNDYTFIDFYVCIIDFKEEKIDENLEFDQIIDEFIGRKLKNNLY